MIEVKSILSKTDLKTQKSPFMLFLSVLPNGLDGLLLSCF